MGTICIFRWFVRVRTTVCFSPRDCHFFLPRAFVLLFNRRTNPQRHLAADEMVTEQIEKAVNKICSVVGN